MCKVMTTADSGCHDYARSCQAYHVLPYLGKDAKINHDLDKGTMVNHVLARLTMILASVACLRSLGKHIHP